MSISGVKIGYIFIGLMIVICLVFIGFELGKVYTARDMIPNTVASIDPFIFCNLHDDIVEENNLTRLDIVNIEDYAVDLFIKYKVSRYGGGS
jgi:hypothetical protein